MSLINKVLNDLDKRGASTNVGEATVRVVPLREKRGLVWGGVLLLACAVIGASAWIRWGEEFPRLAEEFPARLERLYSDPPDISAASSASAALSLSANVNRDISSLAASASAASSVSATTSFVPSMAGSAVIPSLALQAPALERVNPDPVISHGLPQVISFDGRNLAVKSEVILKTPEGRIHRQRKILTLDENKLLLSANFSGRNGQWSLEVINQEGISTGLFTFNVQQAENAVSHSGKDTNAGKGAIAKEGGEISATERLERTAGKEFAVKGISKQVIWKSVEEHAEHEYLRAYELMQQGQSNEAIRGFEAVLKLDKGHIRARQALARLLLEGGRQQAAEKVLMQGVKHDPAKHEISMMLARMQVGRGGLAEALATLKVSLPYVQNEAEYLAYMAALYQRMNKHGEALDQYRKALFIKPGNAVWLMGMGISLRAEGDLKASRQAFRQALESGNLSEALKSYVQQQLQELKEE